MFSYIDIVTSKDSRGAADGIQIGGLASCIVASHFSITITLKDSKTPYSYYNLLEIIFNYIRVGKLIITFSN